MLCELYDIGWWTFSRPWQVDLPCSMKIRFKAFFSIDKFPEDWIVMEDFRLCDLFCCVSSSVPLSLVTCHILGSVECDWAWRSDLTPRDQIQWEVWLSSLYVLTGLTYGVKCSAFTTWGLIHAYAMSLPVYKRLMKRWLLDTWLCGSNSRKWL